METFHFIAATDPDTIMFTMELALHFRRHKPATVIIDGGVR